MTRIVAMSARRERDPDVAALACPYCESKEFVKRGLRDNKHRTVQLYLCKNPECGRTFTWSDVKGKHFPLAIVIEAMSYYNLGFTREEACALVKKKFGVSPEPATLSAWIDEHEDLCRYARLRPYAVKYCKPRETVEVVTLAHRQLYRFRYHRAKIALMLQEFGNRRLSRLKDYLDAVSTETPHQYFQDGARMSEVKSRFDKAQMIVKGKTNYANRLAAFVLASVRENKERHEQIQRFMIANDSVMVATEVPVYIRREDIKHLQNELGFNILGEEGMQLKGGRRARPGADIDARIEPSEGTAQKRQDNRGTGLPNLLTGHIDLVQVRNGCVHILDYKPNAAKERPIEQLTWYALALSRLTGLRLFEFKCAWFDEKEYFEFYPLHVVRKLKRPKKRVRFKDGTKVEIPLEKREKVIVV
ncbi:MAG: PD-(D/E)XK nuclease family protein [Patescibacteria group bacterium]|nr:PD-(D/E)XK nuclease family protein [Patescibacteria group bacterium]